MHLRAAISSSALVHAGILAALWCYAPQPPRPKVHYAVARGAPVTLQVTVAAKAATPAASEKRPPEPAEPEEPDAAEIESIRTPDRRVEASAARVAAMQPAARASPPMTRRERAVLPPRPLAPAPPLERAARRQEHRVEQHRVEVVPFQTTARAGAKVDRLPQKLATNQPPRYPADALLQGVEGRVLIRVSIAADGVVTETAIAASSGSESLDRAALTAVRHWRFSPARRGEQAVAHEVVVPVRFSINRG